MVPRATGARSTPNIDSQISSRVARDPLAAQCWIFPRAPLPSLERQTFRLSSRDAPSPEIQSPGRSTRSPPLPRLTLSTFLRGPQRSRNLAATAGHHLLYPLTGRGHRSALHTPSLPRPGPAGLRELVWGERTSTGAPLGSQQALASPVTSPTGRARRGRGGGTSTPARAERSAG